MWAIGEPSGPIENGHHVHRAALHAAVEEAAELLAHLGRVAPVVGRAGVVLGLGADEGAVLHPGHVPGVRQRQVGVGALGVGEPLEGAGVDEPLCQLVVLLGRAVAPVDVDRACVRAAISSTQVWSFLFWVGTVVLAHVGAGSSGRVAQFRGPETVPDRGDAAVSPGPYSAPGRRLAQRGGDTPVNADETSPCCRAHAGARPDAARRRPRPRSPKPLRLPWATRCRSACSRSPRARASTPVRATPASWPAVGY